MASDSNFSLAAQSILDASNLHPCTDSRLILAAALRATVQELKYFGITEKNILAIAAELEGSND
jgi:hypothetical protein